MSKVNGNTLNKWTRNLIKAVMAVAEHQLSNGYTYEPRGLTDIDEDEVEAHYGNEMANVLAKYRSGYVKAVSYSKGVTLDNGDMLAVALRGLTPAQSCWIADMIYGEIPGTHFARYEHLNVGQQRMNSGNRVRAAIRKELTTIANVLALIHPTQG